MGYRFEFDPVTKVLLLRFEGGRLTDELVAEIQYADGTSHCSTLVGHGIVRGGA
jgi:hypothetical protein